MVIKDGVLIKINKYNKLFKKCVIPKKVKEIGEEAFSKCKSLENVVIPDSVISIGARAFSDCESLKEISLPQGLTTISPHTFSCCESLEGIVIPNGVTNIGWDAFSHCCSLERIVIPNSVTSIDVSAFCDCKSLKEISLPDSIIIIGTCAFSHCKSLKEISLPQGLTIIPYSAFFNCESLERIVIPNSVTNIEERAFSECYSLEKVIIPDSVIHIEPFAFYDCNKLDLNIETSLFYINFSSFKYTFDVKKLTIYSESVEINKNYSYNFYEIALNKIRKKELLDKICKCLSTKDITDQICFQYDQHEKFIEMIIEKINNDHKYYYNDKDLNDYVTNYIASYKSKKVVSISFVQAENQENVETVSKKEQYDLKSMDDKPIDETSKIPAYLYEYGLKVGMINEMEKIVRQIGKYLNLCDIPLKCEEHSGFIKEMIDCLLIDKNYNFNESMKYYIKWYIKGYKEKHKEDNINNNVELPVQEGNNSEIYKINKEIETLEKLKKDLISTPNKPKKVSLKKF